MDLTDENPVNAAVAASELGCRQTRMSPVKRATGIKGRNFFQSCSITNKTHQ
jgi:hypothetical protein